MPPAPPLQRLFILETMFIIVTLTPCGPENGNAKIVRGGGWNDHPKHIRSAYRGAQPADVGLYSIGIRLVRSAGETAGEAKSVYGVRAKQRTGRTLIVYFSKTGNTEGLANFIHEMPVMRCVRF